MRVPGMCLQWLEAFLDARYSSLVADEGVG